MGIGRRTSGIRNGSGGRSVEKLWTIIASLQKSSGSGDRRGQDTATSRFFHDRVRDRRKL